MTSRSEQQHRPGKAADILNIYDRMQQAIDKGKSYQTLLDPPPADPRIAHPPKEGEKPANA